MSKAQREIGYTDDTSRLVVLLRKYGEVLPLTCAGTPFWTLNVTLFLDALDESASQVVRASDTGGILMIRRHVLKAAAVVGADLFKLPQTPRGLIYATDSFSKKLRRHNLSGLELVQVWAPSLHAAGKP